MAMRLIEYCEKVKGDEDTGMYAVKGSMWQHPVLALAEFPDGKIRTVRLNQKEDSHFSWPGRTSYKKHTIRCFVTNDNGRIMGHYNTSDLQEVTGK